MLFMQSWCPALQFLPVSPDPNSDDSSFISLALLFSCWTLFSPLHHSHWNCAKPDSQGDYGVHVVTFFVFRNCNLTLPATQWLKTVALYVLSGFRIVSDGKNSQGTNHSSQGRSGSLYRICAFICFEV